VPLELFPALALLYFAFLALVWLLTRTVDPARARPGSVVAQSDKRNAAAGWLFLGGVILAPFAIVAIVVLLAIDVSTWIGAARAARRQRRGDLPVKPGVDYGLGPDWMLAASPSVPYRASATPVLGSMGSPRAGVRAVAGNVGRLVLAAMGTSLWFATWDFQPRRCHGCIGATKVALGTARSATVIWQQDFPDACPTIAQLKAARVLDTGFNEKDVWGNPLELTCDKEEIRARSAGPDRKLGTDDDIRVPPS
jgi:hypothetical protein